jgi:hypothetical protein
MFNSGSRFSPIKAHPKDLEIAGAALSLSVLLTKKGFQATGVELVGMDSATYLYSSVLELLNREG